MRGCGCEECGVWVVWKAMINEPLAFIFVSVSFHLGSRSLPRNRCLLIFQPASQSDL